MALRFNINGLTNELLAYLEIEINFAFQNWEDEVRNGMKNGDLANGAEVEAELKRQGKKLIGYLKANPAALADSYGTGSLMLESNPLFSEYYKVDPNWNKARPGKPIYGRPRGSYINIFGKQVSTWGTAEDVNLEEIGIVEPSPPSLSIENANRWLYQTYLPRAYKLAVKQVDFGKYLIQK